MPKKIPTPKFSCQSYFNFFETSTWSTKNLRLSENPTLRSELYHEFECYLKLVTDPNVDKTILNESCMSFWLNRQLLDRLFNAISDP